LHILDREFFAPGQFNESKFRLIHTDITPFILAESLQAFTADLGLCGTAIIPLNNLELNVDGTVVGKLVASLPDGLSLPIRWHRVSDGGNVVDDCCLPEFVRETAKQVRDASGIQNWAVARLTMHEEYDFSSFPSDGGSGFLPMAVALMLAVTGAAPRPEIWSTGAWDDATKTLQPVELGGKLHAWRMANLDGGEFNAPAGSSAPPASAADVKFVPISAGPKFLAKIELLLQKVDAPPGDGAPLSSWVAYLGRSHNNNFPTKTKHYAKFARELGQASRDKETDLIKPCHLVLMPSKQPTGTMLSIATWQADTVHLLLSTEASSVALEAIESFVQRHLPNVTLKCPSVSGGGMNALDEITQASCDIVRSILEDIARQGEASRGAPPVILVDVMNGTSAMTTALVKAALEAKLYECKLAIGYIRSEYKRDAPEIGSERPTVLLIR
jgi:hypothetical protein